MEIWPASSRVVLQVGPTRGGPPFWVAVTDGSCLSISVSCYRARVGRLKAELRLASGQECGCKVSRLLWMVPKATRATRSARDWRPRRAVLTSALRASRQQTEAARWLPLGHLGLSGLVWLRVRAAPLIMLREIIARGKRERAQLGGKEPIWATSLA